MRVWTLPVAALALMAGSYSDEPTEQQMRMAFEQTLSEQVRGALAFVAETGGPEAVEKLRQAGTDRFEVRSFRKLACKAADDRSHNCVFSVDVGVFNGDLHRRMNGRFFSGPNGLSFASEV